MTNIWEKTISILAGNLNSGLSYLINTESKQKFIATTEQVLGVTFQVLQP